MLPGDLLGAAPCAMGRATRGRGRGGAAECHRRSSAIASAHLGCSHSMPPGANPGTSVCAQRRCADSAQLCDVPSVLSRDSRMNEVVAEAEQEVSEGNIKDIRLSQAHGRDDRARGPTKVQIRIKDQA